MDFISKLNKCHIESVKVFSLKFSFHCNKKEQTIINFYKYAKLGRIARH